MSENKDIAKLKFGVIGCGGQGNSLTKKFKGMEDVEIISACDINEDVLERMKKNHGVIYTSTNLDEFLKKSKELGVDFLCIATPHYMHARQTIAAANAGFHIYCEKPMAVNVKECDQMIDAAKKNNIKLQIGFQHRKDVDFLMLKQMLEEKLIGDVFQCNFKGLWFRAEPYYLNSSPVPENEDEDWEGWRGHWKTEGGSALINQTIHPMDMYLALAGDLESVMANAQIAIHEYIETEDNVAASLTFKNGALGLLQCGTSYKYDGDSWEFYGTKGTIIKSGWRIKVKGPNKIGLLKQRKYLKDVLPIAKKSIHREFVDAILNDTDVYVPGEEGKKSIQLIRGIYRSILDQKRVIIDELDKDDLDYPNLNRVGLEHPNNPKI
jgi:UDP-N-acetyl-2-amino-2-deoxyglucuronate dehydrogenase